MNDDPENAKKVLARKIISNTRKWHGISIFSNLSWNKKAYRVQQMKYLFRSSCDVLLCFEWLKTGSVQQHEGISQTS